MKKFRVVLSLILALAVAFSCLTAFAADGDADEDEEDEIVSEFSDVDSSSIVGKAITELAMRGILTGYPDGTFLPEGSITRAEFAVVVTRLAGLDSALPDDAVTHFSDLDADDSYKWARPYVHMAIGQGVISGFEDGTFRAGEPVTYEQAVKMLMCLLGYGDVCESETKRLQELNSANSWSIGYINYANTAGLIKGTNSNEVVRTQPVNRGVVAQLAYNALSVPRLQQTPAGTFRPVTGGGSSGSKGGGGSSGGNGLGDSSIKTINGTVTATYITALDDAVTKNDYYEITLDGDDVYMLSSKKLGDIDLYDLIGQRVKLTYDEDDDLVTAISVTTSKNNLTTIYSGYVNDSDPYFLEVNDNGQIEYCSNPEKETTRHISLAGYKVIFNGKYVSGFKTEDLEDPESPYFFTSGVIELIEVGSYKTAKISSYKNYVVKSPSTSTSGSAGTVTVFYKTGAEARYSFQPTGGSGEYVVARRNSSAVIESVRDLQKYDVISELTSPEELGGINVRIYDITRNSIVGAEVTGASKADDTVDLSASSKKGTYRYNYEYLSYDPDDGGSDQKYDLSRGDDSISVYLDHIGQIACVATNTTTGSATSWKYGYLLYAGRVTDSSAIDKNKPIEFSLIDETGTQRYVNAKSKVQIDGTQYNNNNGEILTKLKESADMANAAYMEKNTITNQAYQQPVRYKLTSAGLMEQLDTVAENKKPDSDDLTCGVAYDGERKYLSGSRFDDFSVTGKTKIFFIPDDRDDWSSYSYGSYSSMFTLNREYHVEAYNLNSSSTSASDAAAMVLLYKQNDSANYNYGSAFMIVTGIQWGDTENGGSNKISGYYFTRSTTPSASTKTYIVSEDVSEDELMRIECGDIVRFLTNTNSGGEIKDIDLWLDASAPVQDDPVSTLDEALESRLIVYDTDTVGEPEKNDKISAPFRLAYGAVAKLERDDPYYITVSPTLPTDNMDMDTDDTTTANSVIKHKFAPTTHVYIYNNRRDAPAHMTMSAALESELINAYDTADINATRVVTFTTNDTTNNSGYLRFIYIIK